MSHVNVSSVRPRIVQHVVGPGILCRACTLYFFSSEDRAIFCSEKCRLHGTLDRQHQMAHCLEEGDREEREDALRYLFNSNLPEVILQQIADRTVNDSRASDLVKIFRRIAKIIDPDTTRRLLFEKLGNGDGTLLNQLIDAAIDSNLTLSRQLSATQAVLLLVNKISSGPAMESIQGMPTPFELAVKDVRSTLINRIVDIASRTLRPEWVMLHRRESHAPVMELKAYHHTIVASLCRSDERLLGRLSEEYWVYLCDCTFQISPTSVFHNKFIALIIQAVQCNHQRTLRIVFEKCKLLDRMTASYDDAKNKVFVEEICMEILKKIVDEPSTSFLKTHLAAHDGWKNILPILRMRISLNCRRKSVRFLLPVHSISKTFYGVLKNTSSSDENVRNKAKSILKEAGFDTFEKTLTCLAIQYSNTASKAVSDEIGRQIMSMLYCGDSERVRLLKDWAEMETSLKEKVNASLLKIIQDYGKMDRHNMAILLLNKIVTLDENVMEARREDSDNREIVERPQKRKVHAGILRQPSTKRQCSIASDVTSERKRQRESNVEGSTKRNCAAETSKPAKRQRDVDDFVVRKKVRFTYTTLLLSSVKSICRNDRFELIKRKMGSRVLSVKRYLETKLRRVRACRLRLTLISYQNV